MSILDSKVFYDLAKVSGVVIQEVNDNKILLISTSNPIDFCKQCSKTLKILVSCKRVDNTFQITLPATIPA